MHIQSKHCSTHECVRLDLPVKWLGTIFLWVFHKMTDNTTPTFKQIVQPKRRVRSASGKPKEQAKDMLEKYPDRVPVWIERSKTCNHPCVKDVVKHKYLCPRSLRIVELLAVVRKRIDLQPEVAIFMFVNAGRSSLLLPSSITIGDAYDLHKDKDCFLRITYDGENTFG